MKKVYQRVIDPGVGDCMQAAIASLFDDEYENVPAFIEYAIKGKMNEMGEVFDSYIDSKGYKVKNLLHNNQWKILMDPTWECKEKPRFFEKGILKTENMGDGVEGYFYASVLSPGYFKWYDMVTHAVICDKNLNIVHDPNLNYSSIRAYPLSSIIGCNGITALYNFVKK